MQVREPPRLNPDRREYEESEEMKQFPRPAQASRKYFYFFVGLVSLLVLMDLAGGVRSVDSKPSAAEANEKKQRELMRALFVNRVVSPPQPASTPRPQTLIAPPVSVQSSTVTVNTPTDSHAVAPLASALDGTGHISLRSAVEFVNNQASTAGSPNIINIPAGTYILSLDNGTSNQGGNGGGADDLVIGSGTNLGTTLHGTTGIASDVTIKPSAAAAAAGSDIIEMPLNGGGTFDNTAVALILQNLELTGGTNAATFTGGDTNAAAGPPDHRQLLDNREPGHHVPRRRDRERRGRFDCDELYLQQQHLQWCDGPRRCHLHERAQRRGHWLARQPVRFGLDLHQQHRRRNPGGRRGRGGRHHCLRLDPDRQHLHDHQIHFWYQPRDRRRSGRRDRQCRFRPAHGELLALRQQH
jgi:hypothetical protein